MKAKYKYSIIFLLQLMFFYIDTCSSIANEIIHSSSYQTSMSKNHFDIQASYNIEKNNHNTSNTLCNFILQWIQKIHKYKIWGETNKNFTDDHMECSTKNHAGIRIERNTNTDNYYFLQEELLMEKNYHTNSQNTILIGKGKKIFDNHIHDLQIEFGPGMYLEKYQESDMNKKIIFYGSAFYNYQLTENTKFSQKVSLLTKSTPILKSKSSLEINMTNNLSLKFSHYTKWNENFYKNLCNISEKKTTLSLFYNVNF
ncbi:MAG: acid-inducible putative outer membrane protein YdiY [Candidatus Westeberhardia cardiocondylae]|nr:acid-inducible putative outer membrane protein YdiY [Candidatus Westeberhardia cardiocondylae]